MGRHVYNARYAYIFWKAHLAQCIRHVHIAYIRHVCIAHAHAHYTANRGHGSVYARLGQYV